MASRKTHRIVRTLLAGICLAMLAPILSAFGHESRPAYLEITETSLHRYQVLWRTPLFAGTRLPVVLRFPDDVRDVTNPATRDLPDSIVERYVIDVANGLAGKSIEFVGLQATITDVLVRVQTLGDGYSTTLVHPSRPWIEIAIPRGSLEVAGAYVMHGAEHILFGFDHLLFVFALVLIVRSRWVLLLTITAFTLAHSITLSLATLGVVHVSGPPVEASIALSIVLLAYELIRLRHGQTSLTARWPWLVAFSFGLLHGFGFASALTEIGLPQGDIPLALFSFNVGVEIGQLLFITVILSLLAGVKRVNFGPSVERHALGAATYAVGILASFWFIEHLAAFGA
jgi:hydrogenase/urease accessory protein HupE